MEKKSKVQAFASYNEVEPTLENAEFVWMKIQSQHLRIAGDRGPKPNTSVFRHNQLYLTLISTQGATVDVRPLFIDASKVNSLKFSTTASKQKSKLDGQIGGLDEPKVPP